MSADVGLPDTLLKATIANMQQVEAVIGAKGNPAILATFRPPPSFGVFLLIFAVLVVILYAISQLANYTEIRRNWTHYRCDPAVMPFAKFYGHDLEETIGFCMGKVVQEHASEVITPIYDGIQEVSGVVDGVFSKVEAVSGGIGSLLKGFEAFMINFVNSLRLVGTRVRMSFIRVADIFSRVHGIFIAFVYAGLSALTFGGNLICNPLVTFIGTIAGVDICCFVPETPIIMADGTTKPICNVILGDQLAHGAEVCSLYLFDGHSVDMYELNGIRVSGNHYLANGRRVDEHPAAVRSPSVSRLWCLGTSTNHIPVRGADGSMVTLADYEESSDPIVIAAAQRAADRALNGFASQRVIDDFSLGLDPTLRIHLANGTWKQAEAVEIGDRLSNRARVIGVVREECDLVCLTPGGHYVSAAQLVWHSGLWIRAANLWPLHYRSQILCQFVLDCNEGFTVGGDNETFLVRDYRETDAAAVQAPYNAAMRCKFTDPVNLTA